MESVKRLIPSIALGKINKTFPSIYQMVKGILNALLLFGFARISLQINPPL